MHDVAAGILYKTATILHRTTIRLAGSPYTVEFNALSVSDVKISDYTKQTWSTRNVKPHIKTALLSITNLLDTERSRK